MAQQDKSSYNHMNDIVFIADYFVDEIVGGGEKCNAAFIDKLRNIGYNITCIKSNKVDINFLQSHQKKIYIISNFVEMKKECLYFLQNNCKYFIYEHDHKYAINRNPSIYKNFLVPKEQLINVQLYKNSILTICQSNFHCNIVKNNLKFDNIISSNINYWSDEEQNILKINAENEKQDISFILDSNIDHKNKFGAIEYCKTKSMNYFVYSNNNYNQFIKNISKANRFVFLPKTPETFGRVATECKILNMKIDTNFLLGVGHEEWFRQLSGIDLLTHVNNSGIQFINFLKEKIDEQ